MRVGTTSHLNAVNAHNYIRLDFSRHALLVDDQMNARMQLDTNSK